MAPAASKRCRPWHRLGSFSAAASYRHIGRAISCRIPPAGKLSAAGNALSPAAQGGSVLSHCQLLTRTQSTGNVPPRRLRPGGSQCRLSRRRSERSLLAVARHPLRDHPAYSSRGHKVYVLLHSCSNLPSLSHPIRNTNATEAVGPEHPMVVSPPFPVGSSHPFFEEPRGEPSPKGSGRK
jgi:hypothetical protein